MFAAFNMRRPNASFAQNYQHLLDPGPLAPPRVGLSFRVMPTHVRRLNRGEGQDRRTCAGQASRSQLPKAEPADIEQAEQTFAAAKRALARPESLPSERLGTERGTFTRLSDAYWVRTSQLQRQVSKATRDLERAYSERNALRD